MTARQGAPQSASSEQLSRLVVRRPAAAGPDQIAWAIRAAEGPVRYRGGAVAPSGMHRHQADLRLRVSERPSLVTFGKAAYVDLGPVQPY